MRGWLDKRRREQEMERSMQVRQGKRRIQQYIDKQRQMERRLLVLGKRALQLSDDRQFYQIGKQVLWTRDDINRWERYLLSLEMVEARRDQAKMTGEFFGSLQAVSESLLAGSKSADLVKIQSQLESGIAQAQDLEQRLDMFMEMADVSIYPPERSDRYELEDLQGELRTGLEPLYGGEQDDRLQALRNEIGF